MTETAIAARAEELRQAFDQAFAAPAQPGLVDTIDLIGLTFGAEPYALRLAEIDGLQTGLVVSPLPTPMPNLMGVAGFRGRLLPVYDLAALLGYPPSAGRWFALAEQQSLAFAFDHFEEHFRVDAASTVPHTDDSGQRSRVVVRHGDRAWPIIDLVSLVATLRRQAAAVTQRKE